MKHNRWLTMCMMGILLLGSGCAAQSTVGVAGGELPGNVPSPKERGPSPKSDTLSAQLQELDLGSTGLQDTQRPSSTREDIVIMPKQDVVQAKPPPTKKSITSSDQKISPIPPPAKKPPQRFTDIFFDYDSARIRPSERSFLQRNARLLSTDFEGRTLLIEGHCDERGSVEYNLILGKRRAQAVKKYLVDLGIAARRLNIVSYGKERPFCQGHNERCWQLNRRGHLVPQ